MVKLIILILLAMIISLFIVYLGYMIERFAFPDVKCDNINRKSHKNGGGKRHEQSNNM